MKPVMAAAVGLAVAALAASPAMATGVAASAPVCYGTAYWGFGDWSAADTIPADTGLYIDYSGVLCSTAQAYANLEQLSGIPSTGTSTGLGEGGWFSRNLAAKNIYGPYGTVCRAGVVTGPAGGVDIDGAFAFGVDNPKVAQLDVRSLPSGASGGAIIHAIETHSVSRNAGCWGWPKTDVVWSFTTVDTALG